MPAFPGQRLRPRFLSFLLLGLGACGLDNAPPTPWNVLLVTLDTTRADALDGDAESAALAPNLAALAAESVRFPHAYSVAPLTLPAHTSLLSGLIPPRHSVRDNGRTAVPNEAELLQEHLQRAGYATAAFVSSVVLDRGFGLAQGFERYDQPELDPSERHLHAERPARETVRAATDWLESRADRRPFFLWTHFYDPHLPYAPAAEHLARAGGDAYRGEIAALDDALGELFASLERVGAREHTLVVVTADHGESLGEHGEPTHGALCYESALRVPLLFHFPGPPPAPGAAHLASLVDVTPTVLARLGLALPPELDGIDLFDPASDPARGVYFESLSGYLNYGWSPLCGWLDGRGKYLHSSEPEFYLPRQDPEERQDLAPSRRREVELALEHLRRSLARSALPPTDHHDSSTLDAALASLGYARGDDWEAPTRVDLLAPSALPPPGQRTHELDPLQSAVVLFDAGRYADALPLLARITKENARHALALDLEALCHMQLHDFASAERLLRQRLTLGEVADARMNLGLALFELGRGAEGLAELERAHELLPGNTEIERQLAAARARLGR